MNIVLPIIYYAQNFWDKIVEPELSKSIIKSVTLLQNKTTLSFKDDFIYLVQQCEDVNFIEEYNYVHSNSLNQRDLAKIYYDYIYSLLMKYCKNNKIQLSLKEDGYSFDLIW